MLSPLLDSTLDRLGFRLEHPYVENVWLPVLGPTSVLLLRRAGALLDEHPNGVRLDLVELSQSFGLGPRDGAREEIGRHSPLRRTITGVVQFKLGAWLGEDRLGIHTKVPAVSRAAAERLPAGVRALHDRAPRRQSRPTRGGRGAGLVVSRRAARGARLRRAVPSASPSRAASR